MKYQLELSQTQMKETLKAVELLMRLKIGQYQELVYDLCDIHDPDKTIDVDTIDGLFKKAFDFMNKDKKPNEYKDKEWYVLYDVFQVLRKSVHDSEHPTVDVYDLFQLSTEPLPKCTWE